MDAPEIFGGFHIVALIITAAAAIIAAKLFARRITRSETAFPGLIRTLACTGWILVILEMYKQLFLYCIVNDGAYDWWYFPFQLCSVPMYLCILLPFMKAQPRNTCLTFIGGYTFISAAAALIFPEDFLRPYLSLTIHGFVWHGLLLFISMLILFTGVVDRSARGLIRAAGLFAVFCIIAVAVNTAVEPLMHSIRAAHSAVAHNWAAMFYLNPYHISPQPIVGSVQNALGIPAGLVLYALCIIAAGSIVVLTGKRQNKKRSTQF